MEHHTTTHRHKHPPNLIQLQSQLLNIHVTNYPQHYYYVIQIEHVPREAAFFFSLILYVIKTTLIALNNTGCHLGKT
jgi:hypothetical protein